MKRSAERVWLPLAAALAVSVGAVAQTPVLVIKDAWVRRPQGADVAAVYLNLSNPSPRPVIVIGVRSPLATHSMIHESSLANGQSRMRVRDSLVIAPGQTVSFAPGGVHIMLSGLRQNVAVGQTVPLVLLLADGGQLAVAAIVKPAVTQ